MQVNVVGSSSVNEQVQINFDDTLCINIRCMLAHILTNYCIGRQQAAVNGVAALHQ